MMQPPRKVPNKDDYYMGMAWWSSRRSKDPRTQCGALIISKHNIPLGTGYNGPPRQIDDNAIDWSAPAKYPYMKHSEVNAIKHSNPELLDGATLYINGRPCKDCMLDIVDAGVKRVVYYDRSPVMVDDEEWRLSQEIAAKGNVVLERFNGSLQWMKEDMEFFESLGLFDE